MSITKKHVVFERPAFRILADFSSELAESDNSMEAGVIIVKYSTGDK
jgi:hypothetical protein